jgi:hypothetical protein
MKIMTLIGVAVALAAPSLASAQRGDRGGGAVAVQRVDVGRAITPARGDVIVLRGDVVRGPTTGTRIVRRAPIDPNRRRPHNPARRRYYNATH